MDSFVCPKCYMTFRSLHFLAKHEKNFCIGAADPSEFHQKLDQRIRERRRRHQQEKFQGKTQPNQQDFHTAQYQLQKPNSEPTDPNRSGQHLSESHKRQWMQSNGSKQQQSEQRREINLQELATQNRKVAQLEKMLFDLKEQEQRNTTLLESVVDHLHRNLNEPLSVSSKGQDIVQSSNTHLHIPEVTQTIIPVYGGGFLATEISILRLSYLQNGGKDPQILAQLQDLLNEALKVEMNPGRKRSQAKTYRTERTKHGQRPMDNRTDFNRELISTELENQLLEEEIMRLQLRKRRLIRTTTNCQPSEQEMRSMKMDIDLLKHESEINHLKRLIRRRKVEPTLTTFPPLGEPRSQTPPLIKSPMEVSEGLGPTPYDPMAGFVVFYDFLLGLCPSYRVCRLMVGLYSGEQCLGSPSVLPPVNCEPFSLSTHPPQYSQRQQAVLASKQAVPGVQPAPSVSLVMQVQASGGYDIYGEEVTHLAPRGWVKLDIFDHDNHIISGRWKIPVRNLPAKPSMTGAEVNAIPQLDNAELFLRIVNTRDAEIQSLVPISIYAAGIYRYPPVLVPGLVGVFEEELYHNCAGHQPSRKIFSNAENSKTLYHQAVCPSSSCIEFSDLCTSLHSESGPTCTWRSTV